MNRPLPILHPNPKNLNAYFEEDMPGVSICSSCKKHVYLGGPITKGCATCLEMYKALQEKRKVK